MMRLKCGEPGEGCRNPLWSIHFDLTSAFWVFCPFHQRRNIGRKKSFYRLYEEGLENLDQKEFSLRRSQIGSQTNSFN